MSDVSRRTFYRYFVNKNELLNHYFEQIINRYLTERKYFTETDNFQDILAESNELFSIKERENIAYLDKTPTLHFFFHQFNEHAKEVIWASHFHGSLIAEKSIKRTIQNLVCYRVCFFYSKQFDPFWTQKNRYS